MNSSLGTSNNVFNFVDGMKLHLKTLENWTDIIVIIGQILMHTGTKSLTTNTVDVWCGIINGYLIGSYFLMGM